MIFRGSLNTYENEGFLCGFHGDCSTHEIEVFRDNVYISVEVMNSYENIFVAVMNSHESVLET